ncbi:Gfo/Idh/MocA family protein [Algisphaera agarilytica]|uniref:Putative dehydrogenase n=1 Tax=Algisphaera agarilytica TaxID=1385975 RepID=A0A7X0LJX0_9BACT|nr:Gfo/Idh/MocA family oxidoreductase [Algisphaera agarilytica]MBB6429825.1 putative dehydrogenase [Algisphaera agarilytica]
MSKKIGLMGCGNVATYGHLPAIRDTAGLELHAIYDPDASRARDLASPHRFNVRHACHTEEAFFASGIDAVAITSPAPAHEANVLAAAKHGLPILCEKPLSMSKEQGQRMIEATDAAGVPLYVAFCYRFSPSALKIKDLVAEGAIGDVRSLRLIYNWDCHGKYNQRDPEQGVAPHRHGRMLEGGPMVDCGTHQIDLAQWWLGSPVVNARGHGAWADDYEAPDHVYAHLDHDNGAHTMVEISYGFGHTMKDPESLFLYQLIGTDGVITYDRNIGRFELRNTEGTQTLKYHHEKDFAGMYRAFAKALETGDANNLPTAAEGLRVTDLAVEVTEQVMEARRVVSE